LLKIIKIRIFPGESDQVVSRPVEQVETKEKYVA
jgi:hypothetical protein